jgi:hypothetical protein
MGVRAGRSMMLRAPVPVAAVDEDDDAPSSEDDIGFAECAGERTDVDSVA